MGNRLDPHQRVFVNRRNPINNTSKGGQQSIVQDTLKNIQEGIIPANKCGELTMG
jgi:hypothetical protein